MVGFHGSYLPDDVVFLLNPIELDSTDIGEKEKLIQSGTKHYSEMITKESLPTEEYLSLFKASVMSSGPGMARDVYRMATHLMKMKKGGPITLVSLARAGTPVGVLVKRVLTAYFDATVSHYSVSIIRDRGIDVAALDAILDGGHAPESIVFIDGWTGKGVISRELAQSVSEYNLSRATNIDTGLYVLNDLAGTAAWCSGAEDYLIPSSILNATVSGLISRSILNDQVVSKGDFHGCLYYQEFESSDLSLWFVEKIISFMRHFHEDDYEHSHQLREQMAKSSMDFIEEIQKRFGIKDINLIKPGIGESTRVMLRRVPDVLIVKNLREAAVQHLIVLAKEKNIEIVEHSTLLYEATAIIRESVD
jgi:hypothetical protein